MKRIAAVTVAVVCLLAATSAGAVSGQEKNAIRAARNYLSISAFSCSGLIQQLDSSAGAQFTVAQAKYGAKKAGAC